MTVAVRQLIVLIVDDDPGDVLLVREVLERAGHTRAVHVASNGQEAVDFLRRRGEYTGVPRPDIVLLDLNMPHKDGRQVLAEIKTDQGLLGIPTLVFTASQDPADIAKSYSLHANAYITKPVNLDALTDVVIRIEEFFAQVAALPTPADATSS